jgi:hypothetical protein
MLNFAAAINGIEVNAGAICAGRAIAWQRMRSERPSMQSPTFLAEALTFMKT